MQFGGQVLFSQPSIKWPSRTIPGDTPATIRHKETGRTEATRSEDRCHLTVESRRDVDHRAQRRTGLVLHELGDAGTGNVKPPRQFGPVSYTHLRAHETRHDLVCRLLLEKKKKK